MSFINTNEIKVDNLQGSITSSSIDIAGTNGLLIRGSEIQSANIPGNRINFNDVNGVTSYGQMEFDGGLNTDSIGSYSGTTVSIENIKIDTSSMYKSTDVSKIIDLDGHVTGITQSFTNFTAGLSTNQIKPWTGNEVVLSGTNVGLNSVTHDFDGGIGTVSFSPVQTIPLGSAAGSGIILWNDGTEIFYQDEAGIHHTLSDNSEQSISSSLSGIWAVNPSITMKFSKIGKQVTVAWGNALDTANSSNIITFVGGIPAAFRPSDAYSFPIRVSDNGVFEWGLMITHVSGTVNFYKNAANANFTGSGSSGILAGSTSWITVL